MSDLKTNIPPYVEVSGSGPNLVLLHGWGLHGGIWQTITPTLEKYYTVHNVDLPGFGHSSVHSGEYSIESLVSSIEEILPEKCFLLGWSLGGVVATAIADKFPEKVDKLVTVASNPCFIANESWPFGMNKDILESFIAHLNDDFKKTLIRFLTIQTMGSPTQKQDVAQLKETVFIHGTPSEKALAGGLKILHDVNLVDVLPTLKMPLLRFYGRLDSLVPVKSVALVDELVPDSRSVIFRKSGHSPFLSDTEEFIKQLNIFCLEVETERV